MSKILINGLLFIVVIIGAVIIYKQIQLQKQNKQREAIKKANMKRIKYGCGIGSVLGGSYGLYRDLPRISSSLDNSNGYNIDEYIINEPSDYDALHGVIIGCPIGAAIGAGINKFKR